MNSSTTEWNPKLYNDKHAFVYDYGEQLIALLNPKKHERILDLGCGSGQLTFKINALAKEAVGIDKSPEMIADAKMKFKNIAFHVGDAEDFSFDDKFDSIFSNATLHWIKNQKKAIKCMSENLVDGGKLVLEFGGKGNIQTIITQLRLELAERGYLEQSNLDVWYFPTIGEYCTALESSDFRVVSAEHYDRPTELADENTGIKDWLSMFAARFFENIAIRDVENIKTKVQENVKETCLIHGKWYADYKRIRVVAVKDNLS